MHCFLRTCFRELLITTPTFFYLDRYSGVAIIYEVAKPVRIGSVIDNESSYEDSRVADIANSLSFSVCDRETRRDQQEKNRRRGRERKDKGTGRSKAYKEVALVYRTWS